MQDEQTNYVDIGPVNKVLNMYCCWLSSGRDAGAPAFRKHLLRVPDYLWVAEDGLKMQGYNGSQVSTGCQHSSLLWLATYCTSVQQLLLLSPLLTIVRCHCWKFCTANHSDHANGHAWRRRRWHGAALGHSLRIAGPVQVRRAMER